MKRIWLTALTLVMCAGTSLAQEPPHSTHWYSQQTIQTVYLDDAQTLFVQRKIGQHHELTPSLTLAVGVQHQQALRQYYFDEAESSLANGSFIQLMFAQGTQLMSAIQRDEQLGRVQQQSLDHTVSLKGPVEWQLGFAHARFLDQQQSLDHWMMGFVWSGELQTKLMLAHGDDVQHYHYQNDTRMTLGVEKVFGF